MTSQRTLAAALLAALATLASLAGTTAPAAAAPPTPPTGEEAAWAEELLALLDEDRRAMGLRSLEASPQMGAVAHAWSRHQAAETRMHANPDYREQIPAGHTAAAEALAWGQRSPRSMYTVLSQAAGPRENIADPGFTHVGVGVAFDADGRPYATIDFARYTDPVQEGEQWSARILELLNADRHAKGMEPLVRLGAMDAVALRWAEQQAGEERMYHNPRHREQIPPGHVLAGENVAWGQPTPERMYTRWYNSPGHYANLFNPEFTHVGIGVAFTPDGYAYGTQNFARYVPAGPAARKPQPPRTDIPGDDGSSTRAIDDGGIGREGNRYFLNDTFSAYANIVFDYANPAGRSYVGDWDGNGTDTFAVRRGKTYFIANAIRGGDADTTLNYGRAGDTTLVGDWDGDGKDTLGVRR